jgi:predicted RecB family nuclease
VNDVPGQPPILLDAYAAASCPVKTQNRYDRTLNLPSRRGAAIAMRATSEALQEAFSEGRIFVQQMQDYLASLPDVVDLRPLSDVEWPERERATIDALAGDARVVIGPQLPIDSAGHRSGQPDLLVRGFGHADGRPGYYPVQIKRHQILERGRPTDQIRASRASDPLFEQAVMIPGLGVRPTRERDLLQIAHYWRMLQAAGWEAQGAPFAGLLTIDQLSNERPGSPLRQASDAAIIWWIDLAAKTIRTFSRTAAEHWRLRSPLERYDHEFAFRLKVAETARRRVGGVDDPPPMVRPIVVPECDACQWWDWCRPLLGDDDLSLRIDKSRLDVREISVLRSLGVTGLADLADANLDELLPHYLPEVSHRPGAEPRLRLAARRARMLASGVELERQTSGPVITAPRSLEIDLDIETSADNLVYLWGFLIDAAAAESGGDPHHPAQPRYQGFASFVDLSDAEETALARRALGWLAGVLDRYPDALVFHYSEFETQHIRKLAQSTGDPVIRHAVELLDDHFVDLFAVVRRHFFGAHGLGLKTVAHAATGFTWRDEDPGGLNSQRWFTDAVHGADETTRSAARDRVLAYNEDDVRATHALRRWLRQQTSEVA